MSAYIRRSGGGFARWGELARELQVYFRGFMFRPVPAPVMSAYIRRSGGGFARHGGTRPQNRAWRGGNVRFLPAREGRAGPRQAVLALSRIPCESASLPLCYRGFPWPTF